MKRAPLGLLASCSLLLAGCASLPAKIDQFEKLGITEAEITGKWSHTTYRVEERDGQRIATLEHSNAWTPRARLVRRTPAPKKKDDSK